jgi:type I restriction enzyme S subunit
MRSEAWVPTTLGAEVDLLTGFPFKSSLYANSSEDVKLLRGDNIAQGCLRWDGVKRWPLGAVAEFARYQLQVDDVVLAMDRPWIEAGLKFAAVSDVDLPSLLVQRVARLRGTDSLDKWFLRYLISSSSFTDHILAVQTGTAVPHISGDQIRSFRFRRPPMSEQKAIGRVLGALDQKIDLNRRMNQTLDAIARAIFKSWFLDIDQRGMPEGWQTGSLLEQADLLSGGTPNTSNSEYWGGEILWASAGDVSQCAETFLIQTARSITEKGLEESSTRVIPPWATVVVARGATTGRLTMFGEAMAMNQTCYALVSKFGADVALFCQVRQAVGDLVHAAHGSVFDTLTTRTFQSYQAVLPEPRTLLAFEERVRPLFEGILGNQRQSRTLATLRDTLLPKLLSGEIRVKQAEKLLGEAL